MDYDPKSCAPINFTRHFALPASAIFEAWTTPRLMARWIFSSRTGEIHKIDIDLRVGGTFTILERVDGEYVHHIGTFQKIDRPHILAFTLEVPQRFPGISRCVMAVASTPDGCVMTFQQSDVAKEIVESNWRAMFRALADVLDTAKSARAPSHRDQTAPLHVSR